MISKVLSFKKINGNLPKNWTELAAELKPVINKGLFISDFKRFWWLSLIFALALIVILPLQIFLQGPPLPGEPWKKEMLMHVLDFSLNRNGLQMFLLMFAPVALGTLLFRYMQTSKSTAMAHALPVSRYTHFMTHCLTGIILLAVPVLITGAIMLVALGTSFFGQLFTVGDIVKWTYLYLIFAIFLFSSAVFAGMLTGNSIAQMIFAYLFNVLPAGIYMVVQFNLGSLLFGYPRNYNIGSMGSFLPVINLMNGDRFYNTQYIQPGGTNTRFDGYIICGYLAISVALLIVSVFLYRVRKLEAAGDLISFSFARPVFKYGTAFCLMLLCSMYVSTLSRGQYVTTVIGYIVGSFVGYVIAEMLLQKSFKILGSYKGYLAFFVIAALTYGVLKLDITGYTSRVPAPDDVKSVYFGGAVYDIQAFDKALSGNVEPNTPEQYIKNFIFSNKELINRITEMHRAMTVMKDAGLEPMRRQYGFVYVLKNGGRLIREYTVDESNLTAFLKPIYETEEYKRGLFPVTGKKSGDITEIRIRDQLSGVSAVTLTESKDIEEFINILKQQVAGYTYEDSKGGYQISAAEITYRNSRKDMFDYFAIRKKDKTIIQWLKSKGYYEKAVLLPDKVDSITLEYQFMGAGRPKDIEITDKKLIEKLLDLDYENRYDPKEEQVQVMFHNNRGGMGYSYPKKILLEAGFGEYLAKLDKMQ